MRVEISTIWHDTKSNVQRMKLTLIADRIERSSMLRYGYGWHDVAGLLVVVVVVPTRSPCTSSSAALLDSMGVPASYIRFMCRECDWLDSDLKTRPSGQVANFQITAGLDVHGLQGISTSVLVAATVMMWKLVLCDSKINYGKNTKNSSFTAKIGAAITLSCPPPASLWYSVLVDVWCVEAWDYY